METRSLIYVIFYRLLLDIAYFQVISPVYSYMGFHDYRKVEFFVVSWILLLVSFQFLTFIWRRKNGSAFVILYVYLVSFVPFTTCVYAGIMSLGCILGNALYWTFLLLLYRLICKDAGGKQIKFRLGHIKIDDEPLQIWFLLMLAVISYVSYYYANFRVIADFDIVYQYRSEARNYPLLTVTRYLFSMSRMTLAILWGYFIYERKWIGACAVLVLQVLNFGIDGSKNILFVTLLVGSIFVLCKKKSEQDIKFFFCKILSGMVFGGILEEWILGTHWILGRIVRRFLFVPNYLHEVYYDYFAVHEVDMFRGSFLRWLGYISSYSQQGGIPQTIGKYMGSNSNANNGLFSDAMANMGLAGIVMLPLVIVLFLFLFDVCTIYLSRELVAAAAFPVAWSFTGSSFGTVLLTHGALLALVLMMFMRRVPTPSGKAEASVDGS